MISDEEKKAIDKLKRSVNYFVMPIYETKIILELIEKQSKEIEELKKENLEIRDWKYVIDSPIDLDKLKELDLIKIKGKEYVSKDKIKAKIEELEKLDFGTDLVSQFTANLITITILQSLLEKE